MFASAALVVEGDDVLGWPGHVGDDEAYARVEFARMPFDLGDDTARFRPGSGLIDEVRVEAAHLVRRTPDRAREQVANPLLQDAVGGKPDRIFDALGLQVLLDIGIGEAGVGAEIDARDLAAIARHDRFQNVFPSIGAVHIAGTQGAAFQIPELVEHE